MPPDLVLSSIPIGSNYPCFELVFMVPKVLKPLKLTVIITNIKNTEVVLSMNRSYIMLV